MKMSRNLLTSRAVVFWFSQQWT